MIHEGITYKARCRMCGEIHKVEYTCPIVGTGSKEKDLSQIIKSYIHFQDVVRKECSVIARFDCPKCLSETVADMVQYNQDVGWNLNSDENK